MEYEDLLAILAGQTGKTKEELKALPPEEFAKQLVMYVNTLEPQAKNKILQEINTQFPGNNIILQEQYILLARKKDKTEKEIDLTEIFKTITKNKDRYVITSTTKIDQDFIWPAGKYQLSPGAEIHAKDCKLMIQPGTQFIFNENTGLFVDGGQLLALGEEEEKIEFLPVRKGISAHIALIQNYESKLDNIVLGGFKGTEIKYKEFSIHSPLSLCNSDTAITNSEVKNNETENAGGGLTIQGSSLRIENTSIHDNKTNYFGGGILLMDSRVTVKNCKLTKNVALHGGGFCIAAGGNIILENCDIESNSASMGGGAMIHSEAAFKNCRIRNNRAGQGGAISNGGYNSSLDNKCIIEGNSKPQIFGSIKYNPSIIKDGNE